MNENTLSKESNVNCETHKGPWVNTEIIKGCNYKIGIERVSLDLGCWIRNRRLKINPVEIERERGH
jgi:hypothetical protein